MDVSLADVASVAKMMCINPSGYIRLVYVKNNQNNLPDDPEERAWPQLSTSSFISWSTPPHAASIAMKYRLRVLEYHLRVPQVPEYQEKTYAYQSTFHLPASTQVSTQVPPMSAFSSRVRPSSTYPGDKFECPDRVPKEESRPLELNTWYMFLAPFLPPPPDLPGFLR